MPGENGDGALENGNDGTGAPGANEEGGTPENGNDGTGAPGANGEGGAPENGNDGTGAPGANEEGGTPENGNDGTGAPGANGEGGTPENGGDSTETPEENEGDAAENENNSTETPENENGGTEEAGGSNLAEPQNESAPIENDTEKADETARVQDSALLVQSGVFVVPVYLSSPAAPAQPQTLERSTESVMITGVTWQSAPAYDGNTEGTYTFTAILPGGYALAEGTSLPQITVTVQGEDPVVQELLARIAALPEAEAYLADEPDVEAEEEYEAWMDGLSAYAEEALAIWETYEALTAEKQMRIPAEALAKLTAWVELAEQFAEGSQVMAAADADGWTAITDSDLLWKLDGGKLTIKGSGDMPNWSNQTPPWYDSRSTINEVVIENGVTSIGSFAFQSCVLTSMKIPNGVTRIGSFAFWSCHSLTSVEIPESVTSFGTGVFQGCTRLNNVTIPKNVTAISDNLFANCSGLTNVTIPQGVTSIGGSAFSDCSGLTSLMIPMTVTSIGGSAFSNCSGLTNLVIPGNTTSIGSHAFFGCSKLRSIMIPAYVTTLENYLFKGCSALTEVVILGNVAKIDDTSIFGGCTSLTSVEFKGTTIPKLCKNCFADSPCVAGTAKGLVIPTCKYLTDSSWSQYRDHVSRSHTLTHTAEKPATCEATGTKEYWTCSACSTKFSDAAGTTVITAPVTIPAKGHNLTYKASGQTIVESCSNGCGHSSQAGFTNKDGVTVPCTYTGSELKPFIITKWSSWLGTLPSISYKDNVNAGTATAFLSIGSVSVSKTFTIAQKAISDTSVTATLPLNSYSYTGSAITPTVTVKDGSRTLTAGTDYTVKYENNTAVGSATITITGKGNYADKRTEEFTIGKQDLSASRVTVTLGDDSRQYTGQAIELPHAQVTINDIRVTEGTDYTIRYENNINAGSDARIIIMGKGNYTGECARKFTIEPKPLTDAMVTLPSTSYPYTGNAITPDVTVKDGSKTLAKDTDYTVAYADNKAVGTATVTVTGKGNYSGTRTLTFTIQDKAPEVSKDDLDFSGGNVTLPDDIKDKVEIYDSDGNKITPNPDGSLPVEPGTTIKIKYPGSDKETVITMPSRPAAPASPDEGAIERDGTTITVPKPEDGQKYEFVLVEKGKEPDWSNANHTGVFEGTDPNKEYDIYMREAATEDNFASEYVKIEIGTSGTVPTPTPGGDGKDEPGNKVTEGEPSADGSKVTYEGTCTEGYTPVITIGGKTYTPEITWNEDGTEGTWTVTVPAPAAGDKPAVNFNSRQYEGLDIKPDKLRIYANDSANESAEALAAYLRANCVVKAKYDNGTSDDVALSADYKTTDNFAPKGGTYKYTVEAAGDTRTDAITLTVSQLTATVTAPQSITKECKPTGYTAAEVSGWLPKEVTVTYTGDGYAGKTENVAVTWTTDSLGADLGKKEGNKTVTGTAALPEWATGNGAVNITLKFADRRELTAEEMTLDIHGWAYGAKTAPEPQGSVTVTDTDGNYTYLYSADDGASWVAADRLPKSGSGNIIPGNYKVKMTYTGRNYSGTKTTSFTVVKKPLTVEPGTLAVENKDYDGTTKATLKKGGKPALSGVIGNDEVSPGGTLKAEFKEKGPKKDIPVTVTGFALAGKDAGCYQIWNSTLTLKATISKKDGGNSGGGNSGGDNSGGSNSGGSSSGGNNGGSNSGGNNGGSSSGGSNNGGNNNNGGSNNGTGNNSGGTGGKDGTAGGKDSTGGKDGTSGGKGGTTGKDGTSGGKGGTTGKDGTTSGKGGVAAGKDSTGTTGKDSTAGTNGGNGGNTAQQPEGSAGQGAETGNADAAGQDGGARRTVQTVEAETVDGRVVIPDNAAASGATGSLTENDPASTRLLVGNGSVVVTVVCEDENYTAGTKDAAAVANAVLTPEQIALADGGETLEVRVDIRDISDNMTTQDMEAVEKGHEAYEKYYPDLTLGGYVDISVYMKAGEGGWSAVTETREPLEVVIGIPEELKGDDRIYYIIRTHEGRYTLLNDMDDVPETITIMTDRFSSYAIAYRALGTAGANNEKGGMACGLCHICPTFLGICCYVWLAAGVLTIGFLAASIVIVVFLRRRREERPRVHKNLTV